METRAVRSNAPDADPNFLGKVLAEFHTRAAGEKKLWLTPEELIAKLHALSDGYVRCNGSYIEVWVMHLAWSDFEYWKETAAKSTNSDTVILAARMMGRALARWQKAFGYPLRVPFQRLLVIPKEFFGKLEACEALLKGFTEQLRGLYIEKTSSTEEMEREEICTRLQVEFDIARHISEKASRAVSSRASASVKTGRSTRRSG